jgi:deazaflavin-dependent oxidoreductase (nitroreductase family)
MAREFEYNFIRRIVNKIFIWLLRSGLARGNYYLLTVAGRKTGRLYSVPVALVEDEEQRWLVAPYGEVDWVKNARVSGVVTISRGKDRNQYKLRELSPESAAPILKRYVVENPITRPYFDAQPDSPVSAFLEEVKSKLVFELIKESKNGRTAMSFIQYEITQYSVSFNSYDTGTEIGNVRIVACIEGTDNTGNRCLVYFIGEGDPLPCNKYGESTKTFATYRPEQHYLWFIDLLRNEKPVYCRVYPDNLLVSGIHTGNEPAGEGEI